MNRKEAFRALDRAFMRDLEVLCRDGKTLGIRSAAVALLRACEDAVYHQIPIVPERIKGAEK